jgi:tetratricopeptide (TPR) repeat protein
MNSDQDKPRLPARRYPPDAQIRPETNVQTSIGFLPKTGSIEADERIPIAREEGYDPMAVELALNPPVSTSADKLRLLLLTMVAALVVILFFPFYRFFKPAPRDLGPMSIGGPIMEEAATPTNVRNKPWLGVLIRIDELYFREGKLSEAIKIAESALGKIPQKDWETWQKVYYRYWELLSDAGRIQALKTSARAYLTAFPEDPFANYYNARAFLTAADRIRAFTPETKRAHRQEAETVAQQIESACSALDAQRQNPDAKKDKMAALTDLYQKLRLEQAKLYVLIWKLGGYEEDEHPDVVYRDKALDICESEELVDMKEVKALRAIIYTHILDRWHWIEGRQIVQNHKLKRKDLQKKLESLIRELEKTKKL